MLVPQRQVQLILVYPFLLSYDTRMALSRHVTSSLRTTATVSPNSIWFTKSVFFLRRLSLCARLKLQSWCFLWQFSHNVLASYFSSLQTPLWLWIWKFAEVAKDVLDALPDLEANSSLLPVCNVCSQEENVSVCKLGLYPALLPNIDAAKRRQHEDALRKVGNYTAYWCLLHQKTGSQSTGDGPFLCVCLVFLLPFFLLLPYAILLIRFATLQK